MTMFIAKNANQIQCNYSRTKDYYALPIPTRVYSMHQQSKFKNYYKHNLRMILNLNISCKTINITLIYHHC